MPQTSWFQFGHVFDIPVDASAWPSLDYHKPGPVHLPNRPSFNPTNTVYGLQQRPGTASGLVFRKMSGVYIIAYQKMPIYVGHAMGAESIHSRLGKHRIKLTGSNWGIGVHHPARWRNFVQKRYTSFPSLAASDCMDEFEFSVFPLSDPSPTCIKWLEGKVYCAVSKAVGVGSMLNDPARVKSSTGCRAAKACPFNVVSP